jgi:hypothetical protein
MKDRGTVTDWICFHQEIWNEFDNRETFNLYFIWRNEFYWQTKEQFKKKEIPLGKANRVISCVELEVVG